jgi:hypothetical protein
MRVTLLHHCFITCSQLDSLTLTNVLIPLRRQYCRISDWHILGSKLLFKNSWPIRPFRSDNALFFRTFNTFASSSFPWCVHLMFVFGGVVLLTVVLFVSLFWPIYIYYFITHRFKTTISVCVSMICPSQFRCCTDCLSPRLCCGR